MPSKINFINGMVKLTNPKSKKMFQIIPFFGVVAKGNNEDEIRTNFDFSRIRGKFENEISKATKDNRITLEKIEIVKDLGDSND